MTEIQGTGTISFIGAGDCGPTNGPGDGFPIARYSELVRPTFAGADLRFGNCERQYSRRKVELGLSSHGCQPPEMAQIFTDFGFDAMTIANNHMYDFGPDALLDTRAILHSRGIQVTGAGKNLAQAREPAIVERKGVSVGFLGYCSVLPPNGEAGPDKVGIAPLRVRTFYDMRGPHAPARVRTEPDERDLKMIREDVAALRRRVDVVMVAFHWGVDWVPRVIADYQVTVAHACVDAGADLVMGHHPHVLKAVEVYKGKAIFYCMGTLCMTNARGANPAWNEPPWLHGALRNHNDLDSDYPLMPYGRNSKWSILVKAVLSKNGVERVALLPMVIDRLYRPEILRADDTRFGEVISYIDWASDGFEHQFKVEGDEVVLTA